MTVTDTMINTELKRLPEGWRWMPLKEVCQATIDNRDPRRETERPFTYVDISSIDVKSKQIVGAKQILGRDAPSRARQVINAKDVIVSTTRPNLNAVALIPENLHNQICSTGFCILRPTANMNPAYLFFYVQTNEFIENLSNSVKGALYPAVTDNQVKAQLIPLPPTLAEQERIAGILNEHMAAVEKARTAAEARLEAAKALPAAYLRAVFSSEQAKRWRRVPLGNIGLITDGDWILNTDYAPSGVRLLQVGDVGVGRFIGKSSRFIPEARAKELNCTFLHAGDILISRMPDPIGRACVLPSLGYSTITAVDVSIFRPDVTKADHDFLVSYFCSAEWFQRVLSLASGATRPRISRSNLEQLEIPLPSLPKQLDIAARLTDKMTVLEIMLHTIQQELDSINALPAALLRRAFTGGL